MDTLAHFRRLFDYDDWANQETLASLERIEKPPRQAVHFLAHILAARELWLVRLKQESTRVVVWPELSMRECKTQLGEDARRWRSYLRGLTPDALASSISYTNSKGEPWTSTVHDVLTHVTLHGAYHRGQVARALRNAGHTPAYTDHIHATRQGLLP